MRTYTKKEVWEKLAEAQAHGKFTSLLKREGIYPMFAVTGEYTRDVIYNADQIDELVRMIKL